MIPTASGPGMLAIWTQDFGYAGLFHHGPSGLDLATYRTYDSAQGRWISRDPLGEGVDTTCIGTVATITIGCFDPEGLVGEMAQPLPGLSQIGAGLSGIGTALGGWASGIGTATAPAWAPAAAGVLGVGGIGAIGVTGYGAWEGWEQARQAEEAYQATLALQGVMMAKKKAKAKEECEELKGAEHTSNASPSRRPKHQKGQARREGPISGV